jgi:hypothetical protein
VKLAAKKRARTRGQIPVPVYSLRVAAGAFSIGQVPEVVDEVYLPRRVARLPGLFAAQVVGNSMNRVAAPGSLCLWQHIGTAGVPAPAVGERLIARLEGATDPDLGEFTFKRWSHGRLEPMSTDPRHAAIELASSDSVTFIARFLQVLDAGSEE